MKVLIVDDSTLILKFVENALIGGGINADVMTCSSGEEALRILENELFDVMLLDIIMPGIDGLEVLKQIKSDRRLRQIDVLMFTSLDDKQTLHDCFEHGASDYITKPIDNLELISRMKSALRKKQLESMNLRQMEELRSRNLALEQMNHQLHLAQTQMIQQEKMASIGHLAAGVAHEINNPMGYISSNLVSLKGYVNTYRALYAFFNKLKETVPKDNTCFAMIDSWGKEHDLDYIDQDMDDIFHDTVEGIQRVESIVKGLRNFSRIDEFHERSYYNLNEGIENTLLIARNEMKYSAEVIKDLKPLPELMVNGGQINQVILNMLLNATSAINSKFQDQMGSIWVRTWLEESKVYLSIKDNGVGIPENEISVIFNPFFTTKPVGEGTGLGLSISYDIIVNKHGGTIDVKSVLGEWTEFIITLPLITE